MTSTMTKANFNLTINNGQPVISRDLAFKSGDTISFTVALQKDDTATLADLHRKSAEHVIKLLQDWIKQ